MDDFFKPAGALLPLFALLALMEAAWLIRMRGVAYDWLGSAASLLIALGQKLSGAITVLAFGGLFLWLYEHRLFSIAMDTAAMWFALFVCVEFSYYWYHRTSHESRWFWASHSVHHSPEQYNLSAAYRLGWTAGITGAPLFHAPWILLGFPPAAVFGVLALNLVYQYWLHTELVPKLGWLEWVFNTPSHHRVHHATNLTYLDKNYGGVLIIFDRMFGTFQAECASEPCVYGLVKPVLSRNPLKIVFHEWFRMAQDLRKARSPCEVLGYLFNRPGWRPDGSGLTTEVHKARSARACGTHIEHTKEST
jgi:sterol desaturase/sphingolipid hydroxylase (fatty acid hydroxylase superfamily)